MNRIWDKSIHGEKQQIDFRSKRQKSCERNEQKKRKMVHGSSSVLREKCRTIEHTNFNRRYMMMIKIRKKKEKKKK